jgi:hypothetical protein
MAYRAGAATIDITPPIGIGLVGYHRAGPADALLDRLYATVLVLEHTNARVALVNMDHAGMLVPHVTAMRQRLGSELGISPAQVMVLFTHTHSGPQADDENELARAYRLVLEANLVHAAREAARRLRPCTAAWGVTAASIGVNRRQRGPDGKARMGVNPDGPVDRRVGVLALYEAGSGRPVALLVICTAHANVLRGDSTAISADFPGVARQLLCNAAGCPILIGIGAAGNVNPRWRGSTADLERMGQALASPVLALLPELEPSPVEVLWIGSTVLDVPLLPLPAPDEAAALAQTVAREWDIDTTPWLEVVRRLWQAGQHTLSLALEVQALCIGDGVVAGIPMEPFAEIALELSRRAGSERVFLCGCTNGWIGYLPPATEFPFGGYEVEWSPVGYGLSSGLLMPVRPDTADRVVAAALTLYERSRAAC